MLKALILAATLVGIITAATDAEWTVFKSTHKKAYSQEEDYFRRLIYEENLRTIKEHNEKYAKGMTSFYLGENEFADLTNAEFTKMWNGVRLNGDVRPKYQGLQLPNSTLPTEVNWVKKGYVTPVKNQGQCGSCWSFSATGAIEGAHFKSTGKLVSLSEKNLMDCSKKYGDHSCEGGLMDNAFRYVIANKGIDTEASYPYQPKDSPSCRYNPKNIGATISSFQDVPAGSEMALQHASATVGPVSVAIDAAHSSFQLYRGGVYDEPMCSSTQLDHGVLVAGYGNEGGKDYWLVKNSWGANWGESGYIKMTRNKNNQCGIASKASYPIV